MPIEPKYGRQNHFTQCVSHANVREELSVLIANSDAQKGEELLCPKTIGGNVADRLSRFALGSFNIREISALLIKDVVREVVKVKKVALHSSVLVRLEGYAATKTDSTFSQIADECSLSARTLPPDFIWLF
jgi:hypothetical protein